MNAKLTLRQVGVATAKLLALLQVPSEVVLTDFYPIVLQNLRKNVEANFLTETCVDVSVQHLDWSSYASTDEASLGLFDVIFGADIIYESKHAEWIHSCLPKLLKRSRTQNQLFHLCIPLRRTHDAESKTIEDVFARKLDQEVYDSSTRRLGILKKETISRSAFSNDESRSSEEVEYAYYKIGFLTTTAV